MNQKLYTVIWEINIFARSPKEAAKKALKTQRDRESRATVFTVANDDRTKQIDLEE